MNGEKRYFSIFFKTCSMESRAFIRYPFGVFWNIIFYSGLLMFFLYSDTGISFTEKYQYADYKALFLMGYLAWIYAAAAVSELSCTILEEIKQGTFYQLCSSSYPLTFLLAGKIVVKLLIQTAVAITIFMLGIIFGEIKMCFSWQLLVAFFICILGMYGIGMGLAGLTIYYKRTHSIISMLQIALLFVTDTLPSSIFSQKVSAFVPLTICNTVTRKFLAGQSVRGDMIYFFLISGIWLLTGSFLLKYFYNKARKKGNLLFY